MAIDSADYVIIDPLATGPEAVRRAFENQVAYCRDNDAPITAAICQALAKLIDGERGGTVMLRIRKWQGPALSDALPLRIAGGLHALHLAGDEPALDPIYRGLSPTNASELVVDAIERHEAFLLPWLDGPPQTNEAGRSSGFAAAFLWLVDQGLPDQLALYEVGSSAGINLMMRRYRYDLGGVAVGPSTARMRLAPEWRGDPPPESEFDIVEALGCDVAPLDLTDPAQALRLKAYIWPEQAERVARIELAIAAARRMPPDIARQSGAEFLANVLARKPQPGVTRVVMHSVVWQYLALAERDRITALIERAATRASEDTPLAWVSLEANRDTHRHELTVTYWPGGEMRLKLATAHPHGNWIEWAAD